MKSQWDSGEIGCGQLVIELNKRIKRLKPRDTLEVIARDSGAINDLPAWCRMTGNELVSADHPVYVIRRKSE